MVKLFLNKNKNKNSTNKENRVNIFLSDNNKILPLSNIDENVNAYEQYVKEKKESQTYRLSFNITPLCSNVLFNKVTEIVYHEGSDDCRYFGINSGVTIDDDKIKAYCAYKGVDIKDINKLDLMRDTGFSHPECGGLVYHCGYDIFNNHTLRRKNFNVVNKLSNESKNKKYFNTIYDFKRDKDGYEIENQKKYKIVGEDNETTFYEHLYMVDTIYSFEECINENLAEKDGWIGFINTNTLNVNNFSGVTLNKCMNNNKACEMIDMYPDRSLFSFIPKINKYRNNRLENNWDYCLTYPYENYYNNELVQYKCKNNTVINGLKAFINDSNINDDDIDVSEGSIITLRTVIKHNFTINSLVNIVLIGIIGEEEKAISLSSNEMVVGTGYNGKNNDYYFSIYSDEIIEKINNFKNPSKVEIRVRRVSDGSLCEYYFRKFRRIPNFLNTNVYNDDIISDDEIKTHLSKKFNSTINGLGFSRTIYNDRNVQLLYNDDIYLKGLKDNLGREISEIYLTIVKNNEGHKEWYYDKNYTASTITNSRCFSKVTSGVEMLDRQVIDYNIHVINNVEPDIIDMNTGEKWETLVELYYNNFFNCNEGVYTNPKVLEDDININGTNNSYDFFGDVVEFDRNKLIETTLTDVFHRFNTVQREKIDDEYRDMHIDEIYYDDYDIEGSGFTIGDVYFNKLSDGAIMPINIDAEGYYYKPHYKIELKKFNSNVKQGEHTRVVFNSFEYDENNKLCKITASRNYYFEFLDKIYFYNKKTNEKIIGEVVEIKGKYKTELLIKISLPNGSDANSYFVYKPNTEKPYGAYELNDGSGRYLWRELLEEQEYDINDDISKYIFTNNAHYINKQILFKLHRQDPYGEFLISSINAPTPLISYFCVVGEGNDYSKYETMLSQIENELIC